MDCVEVLCCVLCLDTFEDPLALGFIQELKAILMAVLGWRFVVVF